MRTVIPSLKIQQYYHDPDICCCIFDLVPHSNQMERILIKRIMCKRKHKDVKFYIAGWIGETVLKRYLPITLKYYEKY